DLLHPLDVEVLPRVASGGEGEQFPVQVEPAPQHRDRLQWLVRRAREDRHLGVAGADRDGPVRGEPDRRAAVPRLHESGPFDLDEHRVDHACVLPGQRGLMPSSPRASWEVIGGRWASRAACAARSTSWTFAVTGRPFAKVTVSSMPTRRCPPADSAANITGRVVRPMPVADQVAPSGSASTAATSVRASPGMPPGTPITRSQWT